MAGCDFTTSIYSQRVMSALAFPTERAFRIPVARFHQCGGFRPGLHLEMAALRNSLHLEFMAAYPWRTLISEMVNVVQLLFAFRVRMV